MILRWSEWYCNDKSNIGMIRVILRWSDWYLYVQSNIYMFIVTYYDEVCVCLSKRMIIFFTRVILLWSEWCCHDKGNIGMSDIAMIRVVLKWSEWYSFVRVIYFDEVCVCLWQKMITFLTGVILRWEEWYWDDQEWYCDDQSGIVMIRVI